MTPEQIIPGAYYPCGGRVTGIDDGYFTVEEVVAGTVHHLAQQFVQGSPRIGDEGHIEWNDRGNYHGIIFRKPRS